MGPVVGSLVFISYCYETPLVLFDETLTVVAVDDVTEVVTLRGRSGDTFDVPVDHWYMLVHSRSYAQLITSMV
jgi:hypothetical protein